MTLNEHIKVATGIVVEEAVAAFADVSFSERIPTVSTRFKNLAAREVARSMVSESFEELPRADLLSTYDGNAESFQSDVDKALGVMEALSLNERITEYSINKLLVGSLNRILSDRTANVLFQYTLCFVCVRYYRAWIRFSHE